MGAGASFLLQVAAILIGSQPKLHIDLDYWMSYKRLISTLMRLVMGAIAVSKGDEKQIERLRKELRIPTKSGLIRVALNALEKKTEEDRLRREIQESVRRCATADRKENLELLPAGIASRISGD